ncbi:alpha beta-hydrolase [Ophiostoma piceae UAMH 11346]|uniref:Alpha beta-hydrolase n=1 Tax=Ophiostoma piceae (strain UAMH 11346) TaxID=1262450 RepID=S3CJB3_OPHP1|nr:alpha beta-hydrolase [Ophiostoma piceae UAMH 11346]
MVPAVLDSPDPQVVSADGTRIWAARAGRSPAEAPTIVLVPGFAFPSFVFEKQFQDEQLLSKFCLITYEPRGQGRSTAVSDEGNPWTPKKIAQDFEAVCKYYGASKVFLAGWSYGCIIACDVFASDLGHYIEGLIYIAGLPSANVFKTCYSEETTVYFSPRMTTPSMTDGDTVGDFYRRFVESCFLQPYRSTMPYTFKAALLGSMALTTPTQRRREFAIRMQEPDKLLAAAPDVETLFILGSNDDAVKTDVIQTYLEDNFPRLQTELVAESGHAMFWEKPEEVGKLIVDFVARVNKA